MVDGRTATKTSGGNVVERLHFFHREKTMQLKRIKFVDVSTEHIELIYHWRNEPFIREVMYNSEIIQWENHQQWFQKALNDEKKVMKILYYDNSPYGFANFHYTNVKANSGEWGFYIGNPYAPKGMGKLLAYEMLNFLFNEFKVRKVCAEVIDFNEKSLRFHEKVGFKKEGVLRKHILKNECYCDIHLFSIFYDEWTSCKLILEEELFK